MQKTEKILRAVLSEESNPWDVGLDPTDVTHFLDTARFHGVMPLLASILRSQGIDDESDKIFAACHKTARAQAAFELLHRAELFKVLDAFHVEGIKPLILKGTALAYNLYPDPSLRPRCDTDLLIQPEWRNATDETLKLLGYSKSEGGEGNYIFYEEAWSRQDRMRATHNLDVHWRINNSEILAKTFSYGELVERSTILKDLGPHARGLSRIDSLLFACVHRAGHAHSPMYVDGVAHAAMNRLIWLYDIHLLISQMSGNELDEFAALASAKQIKEICRDALLRTQECFATEIPKTILDSLVNTGPTEPSELYLSAGKIRLMAENFRALKGWNPRMRWAWQLGFPSARYMRWKYPDATRTPILFLYIRRAFNGIRRLLTPNLLKN